MRGSVEVLRVLLRHLNSAPRKAQQIDTCPKTIRGNKAPICAEFELRLRSYQ
jgi:hypothetical protein